LYLFITIGAALMWAAFWGAIRLERRLGEPRLPDRGVATEEEMDTRSIVALAGLDARELVAGAGCGS
jgi:hypothetical protein